MKARIFLAFIVAFLISAPAGAITNAEWRSEMVKGFQKYWIENNSGARFTIWCNPKKKTMGTVIDIDIDGANAPANKRVRILLDNDMIKLPADNKGYIRTKCAVCADSYRIIWNRLRSSRSLAVKFNDERYAVFSLVGARKVLPGNACPADFDK